MKPIALCVCFLMLVAVNCQCAKAALVTFGIDHLLSELTLSGNANVGGVGNFLISAQPGATNSLRNRFFGHITADIDSLISPTTITIQSANIFGMNSGAWRPNHNATDLNPPVNANYGILTDFGQGAIRGLTLDLSSTGAQPIVAGSFANTSQRWSHETGRLDLRSNDNMFGGPSNLADTAGALVPNNSTVSGTISTVNGFATLTLPVQISIPYLIPAAGGNPSVSGTFTYTGTIVAAIPEPSAMALLALTGSMLLRSRSRK